uniref:Uncharacterized protein n=1 Tax=Trichogramma kaykai TaxID=54128 RepID=A0ABD2WAV8_9HYME
MTQLRGQRSTRKKHRLVNSCETSICYKALVTTQFNTNFCLFVKEHVTEKCIRKDLHKIIKSLKALLRLKNIDCVGIVRDLSILNMGDWQ